MYLLCITGRRHGQSKRPGTFGFKDQNAESHASTQHNEGAKASAADIHVKLEEHRVLRDANAHIN